MIRVTGGTFCGRKLKTVQGTGSRPTLGRVREATFNILGDTVVGSTFVDLFAGVGAMGIEALSRGAARAVFIETNGRCRNVLAENLAALGLEDCSLVVSADAVRWLDRTPVEGDILFADPPYASGLAARVLEIMGRSSAAGAECVIIQHGPREVLPEEAGNLIRTRSRSYGDTVLDVYRPMENDRA